MPYGQQQQQMISLALRLSRNDPAKVRRALLESMAVEANFRNVGHGDRDSEGVLQQRPSQGWGPATETPAADIRQFLARARRTFQQGFRGTAGQLAQSVQRSAYPGRYDQRRAEVNAILGGTPPRSPRATPTMTGVPADGSLAAGIIASNNEIIGIPSSPILMNALARPQPIPGTQNAKVLPPTGRGQRYPRVKTSQWVYVPPRRGRWPGPGQQVLNFVGGIAHDLGKPLAVSDTSTHSLKTTSGRRSAHTVGRAVDVPAAGAELRHLGYLALRRAGMSKARAERAARRGGLYNVGGMQIIFATDVGGDHWDHMHVGVRR